MISPKNMSLNAQQVTGIMDMTVLVLEAMLIFRFQWCTKQVSLKKPNIHISQEILEEEQASHQLQVFALPILQ